MHNPKYGVTDVQIKWQWHLKKKHKWTATYWLHQACSDSHTCYVIHIQQTCQLKGSLTKHKPYK